MVKALHLTVAREQCVCRKIVTSHLGDGFDEVRALVAVVVRALEDKLHCLSSGTARVGHGVGRNVAEPRRGGEVQLPNRFCGPALCT